MQHVTGSDLFGDSYIAEPGSSHIEPGITPRLAVVLFWPYLSSAADEAGLSRRYGGIHFQQGDLDGRTLGQQVATKVLSTAQRYISGTVEE